MRQVIKAFGKEISKRETGNEIRYAENIKLTTNHAINSYIEQNEEYNNNLFHNKNSKKLSMTSKCDNIYEILEEHYFNAFCLH